MGIRGELELATVMRGKSKLAPYVLHLGVDQTYLMLHAQRDPVGNPGERRVQRSGQHHYACSSGVGGLTSGRA